MQILLYCFPLSALSFLLCVMIHEFGHFVGGTLSGYKLSSFEIMGLCVIKGDDGFKIRIRKKACLGQCVMFTPDLQRKATLLMIGGVLANLAVALFCTLMLLLCLKAQVDTPGFVQLQMNSLLFIMFLSISLIMNTAAVICNMIPGNPTNDGSTFADARKSVLHTEAYNRIMCIYARLNEGYEWKDIEHDLFDMPDMYLSSLSAELACYRFLHFRELKNGEKDTALKRLERFAPGFMPDIETLYFRP
ncbi:MAG: M50 family metallopeptidase [Lachnospiraceae bacterium]|nr:M50 family metallopeptidase [Lachnospiraceae bacterium]